MEVKESNKSNISLANRKAVQYVIFSVSGEKFGVSISKVSIVERVRNITRVPSAPKYIKGLINLRGEIIPVMSLRLKLGLPEVDFDDKTRIIFFKTKELSIGVIVDSVDKVVSINLDEIESANTVYDREISNYAEGIAKIEGSLITLINFEELIAELVEQE
jgi:purine-binding chemotaxis protein CheW